MKKSIRVSNLGAALTPQLPPEPCRSGFSSTTQHAFSIASVRVCFHWAPCRTLIAALTFALAPGFAAPIKTWDGSSNGNWSVSANWTGNVAPVDGDNLLFPANATRLNTTNDIAGLNLISITVSGSNYVLRGNFVSITNGITASYSTNTSTIDLPIQLDAAQTFTCTNAGAFLVFNGGITNNGHLLTVDGSGTTTFGFTAPISGTAGLTKNGVGNMFLEASNSFSGVVTVNAGALLITHSFALGGTNAGTVVQGSGSLVLESGVHIGLESLTLNAPGGVLEGGGGSNSWDGTITLATNAFINTLGGATINLSGGIVGPGALTKEGPGTLIFSGPAANTYANSTTVTAGTLELSKSVFPAVRGPLVIGDGIGGVNADLVKVTTTLQIGQSSDVTVNNSGELIFVNPHQNQYIGSLAGSGNVSVADLVDFETGFDNATTTFSGVISGTSGLYKIGNGTMTLLGNNTYTGSTSIHGGALIVNGFQPQSPVLVASGILGGTGTVGSVQNDSTLAPGASPGILTCSNLDLVQFSGFSVELNGPTPGAAYDQLIVRGTNNVGGAILQILITNGFVPVQGDSFIIINNDGADPITGTFAGLPEGAVTNVGGIVLGISYIGGDGNDVTLTVLSTTHTWNGISTDSLWTNPLNWVGKNAPVAGDSLVFPPGAARANNTNDFPAGTAFNSITIASNSYVLNGNALTISNGVHGSLSTASSDFNIPLTLAQPQTFTNSGAGTLNFNAALNNAGYDLTCRVNAGTNRFAGASILTGAGGVVKEGAGTLRFEGGSANTYSGLTTVNEGILELAKLTGPSIPGDLLIGDGNGGPAADVVRLGQPLQFSSTSALSIASSGTLNFVGGTQIAGTLNGSGTIVFGAGTALTLQNVLGTQTFSGTISGPGNLTKSGAGKLILSGTNTYSGSTLVQGGTFQVDGFQPASPIQVNGGSRLQGVGTVGNITRNGNSYVIAPGDSPGILTCSNFNSGGSGALEIELNGTSPGTGYDQLNVRGTVNLTSLTLNASLNFASSLSNQFVIINNDGADAVAGTFSGHAEGSVLTIGGQQFQITYVGGDGNDVVLTQITARPALTVQYTPTNTVLVSWPSPSTGFTLQQNTNLNTTNWVAATNAIADNGTTKFVIINPPIGQRYYRLIQ